MPDTSRSALSRLTRHVRVGGLLISAVLPLSDGMAAGPVPLVPEVSLNAMWAETVVCTVVTKAPIDSSKKLQFGTPIDLITTAPSICTSSITGQAAVNDGVRSLINAGFRITSVSHHVTALPTATPTGSPSQVELLISAIFALQRLQPALPVLGTQPQSTR